MSQSQERPALAGVSELFPDLLHRRYRGGPDDPGEPLVLPIAGKAVRIQSLSEREVSTYQAATLADKTGAWNRNKFEDAKRRLIVACLVDNAGNRLLGQQHIPLIADKWDGADTEFLYREISKHCGLNTADIEELVKNSQKATVAD